MRICVKCNRIPFISRSDFIKYESIYRWWSADEEGKASSAKIFPVNSKRVKLLSRIIKRSIYDLIFEHDFWFFIIVVRRNAGKINNRNKEFTCPIFIQVEINFLSCVRPWAKENAAFLLIVRPISVIAIAHGSVFQRRYAADGARIEEQALCQGYFR